MAKRSSVPDEQIIKALLESGSITDAAAAVQLNRRTVQRRMQRPDFTEKFNEAKNAIVDRATHALNARLVDAVNVAAEIMLNESVNPATRLQAAQTILGNGIRLLAALGHSGTDYTAPDDDIVVIQLPAKKQKI